MFVRDASRWWWWWWWWWWCLTSSSKKAKADLCHLLLSHLSSCQTSRIRGHMKVLGPQEDPEKKMKSNSSRKYYAFPPTKRTIRRRRPSEIIQCANELTWPRVSTHLRHTVPPFPQLTNSLLQTTAVGLPAPYEPHGNREHRRTRLLSGVLSE